MICLDDAYQSLRAVYYGKSPQIIFVEEFRHIVLLFIRVAGNKAGIRQD
jgi:hypothetical protein